MLNVLSVAVIVTPAVDSDVLLHITVPQTPFLITLGSDKSM